MFNRKPNYFENKTIVITGASKGLGKQLAKKLSEKKANTILIARSLDLLEVLKNEIEYLNYKTPIILKCDISNETEVKNMVEFISNKYQKIDVLINNAAIAYHKPSIQISNTELRKMFETNFFGPFYCINEFLPLIKQNQSGYILNIGSLVSKVTFDYNSIYASTKCALKAYTNGLRLELKKYNIKVGIFHPGVINTSFQDHKNIQKKLPSFLVLKVEDVVIKILKMIKHKNHETFMFKWMICLMRIKRIFYKS